MPYHSEAQRRWAHTLTGKRALGGNAAVHEWDKASKGKSLPEKVKEAAAATGSAAALSTYGGMKAVKPPQGTQLGTAPKFPSPKPLDPLHTSVVPDHRSMSSADSVGSVNNKLQPVGPMTV